MERVNTVMARAPNNTIHLWRLATMSTDYLAGYIDSASKATAFAAYPDDLVPTRDRSLAGGSLFTYKLAQSSEAMPTSFRRGFLKTYEGNLFGQIASIRKLVRVDHNFDLCCLTVQ